MIWNLWEISAVLAGSRRSPDTNLMKSTRSSLDELLQWCARTIAPADVVIHLPVPYHFSSRLLRRSRHPTHHLLQLLCCEEGQQHRIHPGHSLRTCSHLLPGRGCSFNICVQTGHSMVDPPGRHHVACLLPDPSTVPQNRHDCTRSNLLPSDPLLEFLLLVGFYTFLPVPGQANSGAHLPQPHKTLAHRGPSNANPTHSHS